MVDAAIRFAVVTSDRDRAFVDFFAPGALARWVAIVTVLADFDRLPVGCRAMAYQSRGKPIAPELDREFRARISDGRLIAPTFADCEKLRAALQRDGSIRGAAIFGTTPLMASTDEGQP